MRGTVWIGVSLALSVALLSAGAIDATGVKLTVAFAALDAALIGIGFELWDRFRSER